MPNPILSDKKLEEARAGWAAPTPPTRGGDVWAPPPPPGTATQTTFDDGPISPWQSAMTVGGTINKTAILLALLVASAVAGWSAASGPTLENGQETYQFPALAIVGVMVGFGCVIALYFRPAWAKFLGPIYAVAEGFFVGAISKAYESMQDGIVLQAIGGTIAVFAVMLFLYRTNVIKVTDRFRRIVVGATLGIMALYLVSIVMSIFGANIGFINEPSALGIGFSVFVCALAAFNLALDFDFIERGTQMRLAKDYEWVAAVGLLVTLVWLYLEILRLLAKLQDR
ncbi:MAG: Bax inhibitor-1/YccA family protein [Desertimonas sp.]